MKRQHFVLGALVSAFTSSSMAASLPLREGTYVAAAYDCKDPPFAAMFEYKAGAFSYPHASSCVDIVTARKDGQYSIEETCRAEGDGTPAKPATQRLRIHVLAPDRLQIAFGHRQSKSYRLCRSPVS